MICQVFLVTYNFLTVHVHWNSDTVALQVFAKEEELAEFQAKLGEREAALKAYKTENSRFADVKDKFKADIASLQQQVCILWYSKSIIKTFHHSSNLRVELVCRAYSREHKK